MSGKKIFILAFLFFSFASIATANVSQRRSALIAVINEELKEITRLNKQTRSGNPRLLLRMAELLLEKARHIKEQENEKYLSLSSKKRRRVSKARYFKNSNKFFSQAQKTCLFILKRHKRFKDKGHVYYILAYNAKEFQQHKKSKRYFKYAIKNSRRGGEVNSKSKLALAEIYYNEQRYSKAIPLYLQSLKKIDDKWYTKDTFNLAWCYFRVKKIKTAISLMKKVYAKSKNSKYVDMSQQVERDIAYFYTEDGNTKQAIAFYKKRGGDISKNLLKVSAYLINQGKFAAAEKTLTETLKFKNSEVLLVKIHYQLMNLYDRFGKYGKHLKSSKLLFSYHQKGMLDKNQVESLKYNVQKMAALLQKQAAAKRYETQPAIRKRKAKQAESYFGILANLNPSRGFLANFHAAETNFAAKNFNRAAQLYAQSYNEAGVAGSKRIVKLSLNGLMASLGSKGVSKATKERYLESAYLATIKEEPSSKKAYKIYQRLFTSYMDKKDVPNAEKTLLKFKKNFPKDYKTQEAMLARIMEHYKKDNDEGMIKHYVQRINRGEFKVSKKYAKKLKMLLLTMQFDDVEKLNSTGDKKQALIGYVEIYKASESSKDARKNAAYNIATLFYQLGDAERTYKWAKESLNLMKSRDVSRFESSFLAMATDIFGKRRYKEAGSLNSILLNKVCRRRSRNKKSFFKNAHVIFLADGNLAAAKNIVAKGKRCKIPARTIREGNIDLIKYMTTKKKWGQLKDLIEKVKKDSRIQVHLIHPMAELSDALKQTGRMDDAKKVEVDLLSYYRKNKSRKNDIPLEGLDAVADIKMKSLRIEATNLSSIKLRFPEKLYNQSLKAKFSQLDKVTSKALGILSIGSGRGIVSAYKHLVESYDGLGAEIRGFTPEGKSASYIKSFKKSMVDLTRPILLKAQEFRKEARSQILGSKILSLNNNFFLQEKPLPIPVMHFYSRGAVLMDRGGKR
ncbi:MAG: tetratricopeptide repeat protein [Bacteriovoracaceae bacterium]|nr:tetratricopeptide repeat protein [Bacteriovoracaceae bacterium]